MEKLHIQNQWPKVRRRVKEAYPEITEQDLAFKKGNEKELLSRLSEKTGKDFEELVSWMTGLSRARF